VALYQSIRDRLDAPNGVDRSMRRTESAGVFSILLTVAVVFGIAYAYAHSPNPGPSFAQTSPSPPPSHATPPPVPPQIP
jgi:hypothetical protein